MSTLGTRMRVRLMGTKAVTATLNDVFARIFNEDELSEGYIELLRCFQKHHMYITSHFIYSILFISIGKLFVCLVRGDDVLSHLSGVARCAAAS